MERREDTYIRATIVGTFIHILSFTYHSVYQQQNAATLNTVHCLTDIADQMCVSIPFTRSYQTHIYRDSLRQTHTVNGLYERMRGELVCLHRA